MRIYLLKGRHGFRPQDGFKFMSVVPNVKDLFLFSDAKLLHCCELFVRYYVVFAFFINQYCNKHQVHHQRHHLLHHHYTPLHLVHMYQRILHSVYYNRLHRGFQKHSRY